VTRSHPLTRCYSAALVAATLLGSACGPTQSPKTGVPAGHVGTGADTGAGVGQVGAGGTKRDKIVAEVERIAARKRMKIWGQVERLRKSDHGELPPLTATSTGGAGDPVTDISNQTPAKLTIWFAGKCSHQVDVPASTKITTVFCPGTYNIAAMLEDNAFLPLVREEQEFTAGVRYRLDFFVKKPPSVKKK
jgi:hypothetical protein